MAYMNPTPGVANLEAVLEIGYTSLATQPTVVAGEATTFVLGSDKIVVPSASKITIQTSNGTFEFSTLDKRAKRVVATISSNSIVTDLILDKTIFFGDPTALTTGIKKDGILKAQSNKTRVSVKVRMEGDATTGEGTMLCGEGYITVLNPTVAAEQPVWQSPMTIAIDGDFILVQADTL